MCIEDDFKMLSSFSLLFVRVGISGRKKRVFLAEDSDNNVSFKRSLLPLVVLFLLYVAFQLTVLLIKLLDFWAQLTVASLLNLILSQTEDENAVKRPRHDVSSSFAVSYILMQVYITFKYWKVMFSI